ncbi:MAG: hypothetical protein ACYSW4_08340, partial [Planctomycetota bacterium]
MSVQSREAKVFAVLLVSMTVAVIFLKVLGNNPPSAGAFCLNNYYRLDSTEKAISSRVSQSRRRWKSIRIYYSGTKAGNIQQLASLTGLARPEDLHCHFVICNGFGGLDGQIQSTEKWQRQWAVTPDRNRQINRQTICICTIAD